ncbi:MAG: GNAT family N-acetyltransferase [Pseudomonadota bacterium]
MSTTSIDIRRAEPADAPSIADTHQLSWRQAYTGVLPWKALDSMVRRRDEAWWERAIRQSTRVLVVDIDGLVAGYATLGRNRVKALPFGGEIYEIYLRPEYQGVGLGTHLFLAARRDLKQSGQKGLVVWALEANDMAMEFYTNAGGRDVAEGYETFDGQTLKKIAFAWD